MTGELRRAAFGDLPSLSPALLAAARSPRDRLLTAIALGAEGRYASAATLLSELASERDPVIAAHALTTLASHRRQLGGHRQARRSDAAALRLASAGVSSESVADGADHTGSDPDGLDARGAVADALLGLAADNLGLAASAAGPSAAAGRRRTGSLTAARRLLSAALPRATTWRTRTRAHWVTAEIELATGNPAEAKNSAEAALELATASGACRHVVKSQLVLAAALLELGAEGVERARGLVSEALGAAEKYELRSLIWPASLLATRLWPTNANHHRFRVDAVLHAVLLRCDPEGRIVARESPWVPFDVRSDIRAKNFQKKPPDRVKVRPKASDRGNGMSPGCRKETP